MPKKSKTSEMCFNVTSKQFIMESGGLIMSSSGHFKYFYGFHLVSLEKP